MRFRLLLWIGLTTIALASSGCRSAPAPDGAEQSVQPTVTPVAPVAQPTATPAPSLGRVAFVRDGDLWVQELPGRSPRRLTQDGRNVAPLWSPSGQWLAFQKTADGQPRELWVIRSSGADARRVEAFSPGIGSRVAWSPTADLLAYAARGGLFAVSPDGAERRVLVAPNEGQPDAGVQSLAWGPKGERLAYARVDIMAAGPPPERVATLATIGADGRDRTELASAGQPSSFGYVVAGWSPDGMQVLFWTVPQFSQSLLAGGTALRALPAGGGEPTEITSAMLAHPDFLAWSSDGRQLALVDGAGRQTWDDKTLAIAAPPGGLQPISRPDRADLYPAWSPDGGLIAFTGGPSAPASAGGDAASQALAQRRIWLTHPDGSDQRPLTGDSAFRDERPRWSADGASILFARLKGDQAQLWLMRADGSDQHVVVNGLTLDPEQAGFYGYLPWSRVFDWWTG